MLIHKEGDLIQLFMNDEIDVLVHGCNCLCAMGGGIAKQISYKLPVARFADQELHEYFVKNNIPLQNKLGTFSIANAGKSVVLNAYTQFAPSGHSDVFEYESFERICESIISNYGGKIIGLPYIGMGLANGDPTRIIPVIEKLASDNYKLGGTTILVKYNN